MKTPLILCFVAALAASPLLAADKEANSSNVTVSFHEPDNFSDARERFGGGTDENLLNILAKHLQKVAGKHLASGQKLEVTFTDVDLAGDFLPVRPNMDHVRIIKDVYIPRMVLTFKLTDAEGKVLKSGERKLSDMTFMSNITPVGRNEPLFYDKALLSDWVEKEFKS